MIANIIAAEFEWLIILLLFGILIHNWMQVSNPLQVVLCGLSSLVTAMVILLI